VSVALAQAIGGMAGLSWATVAPPKTPLIPPEQQPRADAALRVRSAWVLVTTPLRELPRRVRTG
jgi:hypothetical protein